MSKEIILNDYAFLVSETDLKGNIIFANDDFCKIAGYSVDELINQPHNIIRHSDMPKAAFEERELKGIINYFVSNSLCLWK